MLVRSVKWIAANGDVLNFGASAPFLLDTFFTGTPSARAEIVKGSRAPGQTTYHATAEQLTPSIIGSMHTDGNTYDETQKNLDLLRQRLQNALDPTEFGTLIYKNYSGTFKLRCRPIAGAEITERIGGSFKIDIEFVSDDPYWVVAQPDFIAVGKSKKMWLFPWSIKPTVFGSLLSEGIVRNPTNKEIFPRIYISDTQSTKITLGNVTTGETLTITQVIEPGQRLIFNMAEATAKLEKDGELEDVTHWITHDSTFPFSIIPGSNELYSSVDNPNYSPIISMIWNEPRIGI